MERRHKNTQHLPRIWLMTDARLDGELLAAVQRLPFGSGVIFRHYRLEERARHRLYLALRSVCRRRGHMLILADKERTAMRWHADGYHNRSASRQSARPMLRSAPVHNPKEIAQAKRAGAQMLLLSPVFATASHPGKRPLGHMRFIQLAKLCGDINVIALGGMNGRKGATLNKKRIHGWAAIDAFKLSKKRD